MSLNADIVEKAERVFKRADLYLTLIYEPSTNKHRVALWIRGELDHLLYAEGETPGEAGHGLLRKLNEMSEVTHSSDELSQNSG